MIDEENITTVQNEKSNKINNGEAPSCIRINLETLRVFSYLYFVSLFLICIAITATEVEYPLGSLENTEMYKVFGFNYLCMTISIDPAKQVGAILAPGFIVPISLFVILTYSRMKKEYSDGLVPEWLWRFNQIVTPFNLIAVLEFGMVFVNDSMDGFIVHFVPYLLLEISFGILAVQQMFYATVTNTIPFQASKRFVKVYTVMLILVMVVYHTCAISSLCRRSVFDKSNPAALHSCKILMNLYSLLVLIGMPTILSMLAIH